MIDTHSLALFGSALPKTCKEANALLALKIGFSAQIFARNHRQTTRQSVMRSKDAWRKQPWKLPHNGTLEVFRKDYRDDNIERAFYQLESKMLAPVRSSGVSRGSSAATKPADSRFLQLTPMQFLKQTREHMPGVLEQSSIDYITLTRTCCAILRLVRDVIAEELDIKHYTKDGSDSNEPGFLIMSLIILREASDFEIAQGELLTGKERITRWAAAGGYGAGAEGVPG
ncbi:hypothetical protein LTR36_001423 [Oleoguttula mirabilis]|uniref:Uncharacterized protein n=1 Tax=Oleoguttula mirabilis TaxID=1507867 RepID=A0AAV9JQD5_9PEZI|nr:hypothetical protein LTR36_001423 [Oleoguttula mirabilis]